MKVKPKYVARCRNYPLWLCSPLYVVDESIPDTCAGEHTAIEAMFMLETHGKEVSCKEPRMLDALKKGKQSREFHIKGWLSMTRSGEARCEEFFGSLGLRSAEEFQSIFGRPLSPPLLRIIRQEVATQISNCEGSNLSSTGSTVN